MKMRNHILIVFCICVGVTLILGQHPVFGLPLFKYDFSGSVTSTTPIYETDLPDIQAGDTFTGNLTLEYDPSLKDQVPLDNYRAIYNSYGSYSIIFENFKIQSNIRGYLPIQITLSTLTIYDFVPVTSDLWSDDLYFRFASSNGPVFDNYTLPYGIDFNAFEEMTIWFQVYGPERNHMAYEELVTSRIDSIVQVPVPEPGTALLLLSGLGIGIIARRKNNKTSLVFDTQQDF